MSALRIFVKMSEQAIHSLLRHGAGGRTRTGTPSLAVDFESTTSTNSITPALCCYYTAWRAEIQEKTSEKCVIPLISFAR